MVATASRFVDLPGRRLHMLEWGRCAAPALVLVHGMRDHAHSWDWLAADLAQKFHVVAPDLRGHGDSEWVAAYDLPDYVRDLADLLVQLALPAVSLVGHSLGGHIVLRYAACFPERVTCLCSIEGVELPIIREHRRTPRPYPSRLREWIESQASSAVRLPRIYATLAEAEARMVQSHPGFTPNIIAHLTRHGTVENAGRGFQWKYDNAARFRAPEDVHGADLDDILAAIPCPALLAYGEQSWIDVPPPSRLARLSHHRVIRFPDAGHWLHLQSSPGFLAMLTAFLDAPATFIQSERYDHA